MTTRASGRPSRSTPRIDSGEPPPPSSSGRFEAFPPGAFSPEGVDLTLIGTWLDLSPEQRLDALQEMLDFVALARRGRPCEAP